MTGFQNPNTETPNMGVGQVEWPSVRVSRTQIDQIVRKAERMRSDAIASWIRRTFEEWASLLRRPGRAIPETFRHPKVNA